MALTSSVADSLRAFGPTTLVVRAVDVVVGTLRIDPGSLVEGPTRWRTLDDAAAARGAPIADVRAFAEDGPSLAMLRVGAAIDGADRALARQAAVQHADGRRAFPLGPQAEDAVLKLLMLGWLRGATGGRLSELASGQIALLVWAAVDVSLPLGDVDLAWMVREHRTAQLIRLVALCGEDGMDGVEQHTDALMADAAAAVSRAAAEAGALALALAPFVPGLVVGAEGAEGRIALQADRLPLYKWLLALVAAEHAAVRALAR